MAAPRPGAEASASAPRPTRTKLSSAEAAASRAAAGGAAAATVPVSQIPRAFGAGAAAPSAEGAETFVTQRAGKLIHTDSGEPLPPADKATVAALAAAIGDLRGVSASNTRWTLQSTLLLKRKKELHAMQLRLEAKRAEFLQRMEECQAKRVELRAKQKQVRDRVLKFEKFLKENDAKRHRADLKAIQERKAHDAKAGEIQDLHRGLQDAQAQAARLVQLAGRYAVYERYLQSVMDAMPPEYLGSSEAHLNDILLRYRTLKETLNTAKDDLIQTTADLDAQQQTLAAKQKEKNNLALVYNSAIGTKQKQLEERKQFCLHLELRYLDWVKCGSDRMRMLSELKLAIDNMYERVMQFQIAPPAASKADTAAVPASTGNANSNGSTGHANAPSNHHSSSLSPAALGSLAPTPASPTVGAGPAESVASRSFDALGTSTSTTSASVTVAAAATTPTAAAANAATSQPAAAAAAPTAPAAPGGGPTTINGVSQLVARLKVIEQRIVDIHKVSAIGEQLIAKEREKDRDTHRPRRPAAPHGRALDAATAAAASAATAAAAGGSPSTGVAAAPAAAATAASTGGSVLSKSVAI